jgi:hypothetical protein
VEKKAVPGYWGKLLIAIRTAEQELQTTSTTTSTTTANNNNNKDTPPFDCEKKARFGVTPEMARINYPLTPPELRSMMEAGGYEIDFEKRNGDGSD